MFQQKSKNPLLGSFNEVFVAYRLAKNATVEKVANKETLNNYRDQFKLSQKQKESVMIQKQKEHTVLQQKAFVADLKINHKETEIGRAHV